MRKEDDIEGVAKTGWVARLKDGSSVREWDGVPWSDVKDGVVLLAIVKDGKVAVSLPEGMRRYVQGKTGSCGIVGGKVTVESRWIGFELDCGRIVTAVLPESNGTVSIGVSKT